MNWKLNIQATVATPANYLVAAIYDHSAPTVVVQSIALPKPYGGSIQIVFPGVDPILYDFKLFESVDTSPAGTIRSSFLLEPTQQTTQVRGDLYLIADTSVNFTSGTTSYTADTPNDLTGWDYSLERVGAGTQQKNTYYAKDTNGFHLLATGDVFAPFEKWVLHFIPIVADTSITPMAANLITGTRIITGNTTLDSTDMGKGMLIQGAGTSLIITLPLLSTVGDNKLLMFFSAGGNHINATILCNSGNIFQWVGGTPNTIILAQNEQLWIFKANGVWNVAFASDTIRMTGEIVDSYSKLPPHTIFTDGSLLSRTIHARLWAHVQTLESGVVVTESSWANTSTINGRTIYINKGKFSSGDGSTNFRLPLIYAVGNRKAIDGFTRLPGAFEADQVGQFDLTIPGTVIKKSGTSNSVIVLGVPSSSVGGAPPDATFPPLINETFAAVNATKETRQANIGVYALIRI